MSDTYLNLSRGNRLSNLGLQMASGHVYRFPQIANRDYAYIEIPIRDLYNPSDESMLRKGARNQYLQVIPACTVNVRGRCRFQVVPNPGLYEYGMVQAPYYLEADGGVTTPTFYIQLRKDLDLERAGLDYAIRIYMITGY